MAVAGPAKDDSKIVNQTFAGRIMVSDKRFPLQAKSLAEFNAKVQKQSLSVFKEDKDKKYLIYFAGFLKAPLNDVEYNVKLYDVTNNKGQQLLATIEQFTDERGQTSLLSKMQLDRKTVGGSFVYGMTHNRGSESIVRATIDLGRQLGLCVVAEGVESVAEMRALAALGCSEIQGYFVAKPLREATVIEWIRSRHLLYESSPSAYFEMMTAQQGGAAGTRAALHS